jgi:hypothetical protein
MYKHKQISLFAYSLQIKTYKKNIGKCDPYKINHGLALEIHEVERTKKNT